MSTRNSHTTASASSAHPRHTGRWRTWAAIAGTLLVLTATFFAARYAGSEAGSQAAREQIEAENDLTAGPQSLIKPGSRS